MYARYTITAPHTGLLLEEFNGALPPHITSKTAADTYVNQRFALMIEEHQRGGKVPTVDRGMTVKAGGLETHCGAEAPFPGFGTGQDIGLRAAHA